MLLDADDSQLVLVDYQTRLMPVIFENELVIANAVRLARMAQALAVPVWASAQNPDKLGPNVPAVQAAIEAAGGKTLSKMHFSAAAEGLGEWLRPPVRKAPTGGNARSLPKHFQKPAPEEDAGRSTIVIAGCEAHVCLMQTALELLEEEFEVWVVTDACSSRSERNRDAAFDRLAGNGAELVTTEMVAFEWLRTAEHPDFKEILAQVK
ncbi:Nicotinamidase-related amidase [Polaromonas sp. OV174]|uniref:isochorismatase family protein n=1 Tax=Polaromonas sp. OV174 TaxID=1855300 RepID=UPI0008EC6D06|nr:isochorismatase family protein [Polaromonas sp. OV174]SFC40078.1 Nicotinamidase-related amidase [Polaromonas sp. OV174]